MNIVKKLIAAILLTSSSMLVVQAGRSGPYAGMTWDQFCHKVQLQRRYAECANALEELAEGRNAYFPREERKDLPVLAQRLQQQIVSFCFSYNGPITDSIYQLALKKCKALSSMRIDFAKEYRPKTLKLAMQAVLFLELLIGNVEDLDSDPDNSDSSLVDARTIGAISDEDFDDTLRARLAQSSKRSDALAAAGGSAMLALTGYGIARLARANRRNAGAVSGLLGVAGLACAAYSQDWIGRGKKWWQE